MADRAMTWEEMFMAIKSLDDNASLMMRFPGNWYVSARIEVKERSCLVSAYGNGETPESAVRDQWKKLTDGLDGDYVVLDAMRPTRRAVKWTGYMWRDVPEPAATPTGRRDGDPA